MGCFLRPREQAGEGKLPREKRKGGNRASFQLMLSFYMIKKDSTLLPVGARW